MISVEEAKRLIARTVKTMGTVERPLDEAVGMTLAETVISQYPLPFFDNSSMDGYALVSAGTADATDHNPVRLLITGSIAAGEGSTETDSVAIAGGQAVQIFTGAPLPQGADAVIRQEDTVTDGDKLIIRRMVRAGENVRRMGEELKRGEVLLPAGTVLTPAGIGTLASGGIQCVNVYEPPRVGIIVTGSEIVSDPMAMGSGKIFDSNSHALAAALTPMNVTIAYRGTAEDNVEELSSVIGEALNQVDVLLVTGGVSVGKFDHVKDVAANLGVGEIFWRIKQKPGKPMFFGATEGHQKILFGLPGNPASVLVCFYEYVRPALLQCTGVQASHFKKVRANLRQPYTKGAGLTHFLKGKLGSDGAVDILDRQGSHMMSSFALADCLVVIPETVTELAKGAEVEVHLLPS